MSRYARVIKSARSCIQRIVLKVGGIVFYVIF